MQTAIDIEHGKLAQYLQIALNQRKRQVELFKKQFGDGSSAVAEGNGELATISTAINVLLKEAAAAPKRK